LHRDKQTQKEAPLLDLAAPPRRPSAFTRPAAEIADLALHTVIDSVLQGRAGNSERALVTRFDYVYKGSRLSLVVTIDDGGKLVMVDYSAPLLEAAAGLLATRLARHLQGVSIVLSGYRLGCTLPVDYPVEGYFAPRPAADVPLTHDPDIIAERQLEATAGAMLQHYREQPRSVGYHREHDLMWTDPVYGIIGYEMRAGHTYAKISGKPDDEREVGDFSISCVGGGGERDLLPLVVDLPAFARRYDLVVVPEFSGNDGVWRFRFFNSSTSP
jgi:hypothetical protein